MFDPIIPVRRRQIFGWQPERVVLLVWSAVACLTATSATAGPVQGLPALGADENNVTVSGISSGANMAVQFQVAHSKIVRGAGIVAGGPYYCAEASVTRALQNCMAPTGSKPPPTVGEITSAIEAAAKGGKIDPPDFLRDDRVWLLSGGADKTVEQPVMDALAEFYRGRLPAAAIQYLKPPATGHALPSAVDPAGNACASSEPPFINRCPDPDGAGAFDAAGSLLRHLLPPSMAPAAAAVPLATTFDQRPFIEGSPADASLAESGYVFVPAACRSGGCRIHVAFHGCRQNAQEIGTRFVESAGYNRWAETNRLIVLYPQTISRSGLAFGSLTWLYNPKACWDWWGYTGRDYHTQKAPQIAAVRKMIRQLAGPLAR